MSEEDEITRAYNVQFNDEWLGIEDFKTIRAEDEETARQSFEEEYAEEGRHEIIDVEVAYDLDQSKVQDLLGDTSN